MILEAHGLRIELPVGWSGRVFHGSGGVATLHAGDFPIALRDTASFGAASTSRMPAVASFIALTEYLPGSGLEAGAGLFASRRIPLPLDPTCFSAARLAHPRVGQAGMQHFFTASGRPFCLYAVLADGWRARGRQITVLDHVLASLRIAGRLAGR